MATPVLPSKDTMERRLPNNVRNVVDIKYDSPLYAAGKEFGTTLSNIGKEHYKKEKEPDKGKPADCVGALGEAATAIQTARKDFDASPDPVQYGIHVADYLDQTFDKIKSGLSPADQVILGPSLDDMREGEKRRFGEEVEKKRKQMAISQVVNSFPTVMAGHATSSDLKIRQAFAGAGFDSIGRLQGEGAIDAERALELKRELRRGLIEADVKAQPAAWRIEMLQKREGGDDKQSYFRRELGAEKSDLMLAQAQWQDKVDKRDGTTQSLLDRFGTAPENESKALAEIDSKHGGDPGLRRLYLGRLQMQRRQERREIAQSAGNFYALAREGRLDEIDPADARRLHKAGQMEGLLEAAQYGRNAEAPGDLLFKERYLAMGEAERAGYGVAELAKRLSPQDFLEVTQGAAGEIDRAQQERMRDFVPLVGPMLRSATLGEYATPQERARDRQDLALIRDEVEALVNEQEKKNGGRMLTTTEYRRVVREVADRALIRTVRLDFERRAEAFADAMAMNPEVA